MDLYQVNRETRRKKKRERRRKEKKETVRLKISRYFMRRAKHLCEPPECFVCHKTNRSTGSNALPVMTNGLFIGPTTISNGFSNFIDPSFVYFIKRFVRHGRHSFVISMTLFSIDRHSRPQNLPSKFARLDPDRDSRVVCFELNMSPPSLGLLKIVYLH